MLRVCELFVENNSQYVWVCFVILLLKVMELLCVVGGALFDSQYLMYINIRVPWTVHNMTL